MPDTDPYCRVCGASWDADSLHEEAARRYREGHGHTYRGAHVEGPAAAHEYYIRYHIVRSDFKERGCEALNEGHRIFKDRAAVMEGLGR